MARLLVAALLLVAPGAFAQPAREGKWVGSWARALVAEPDAAKLALTPDTTVRSYVRLSAGGKRLRVRFSNTHGTAPLVIDHVSVAIGVEAGRDALVAGSSRPLRFAGQVRAIIPPGAEYVSDPVDLAVNREALVAVTYHLPEPPAIGSVKGLPRGFAFARAGVADAAAPLPGAQRVGRLHQLAGVEVETRRGCTIAVLGDSITESGGASLDGKGRWTDVLATRMTRSPRLPEVGLVNLATSGGRLAKDETGPAGLARADREIFSQPNLCGVILFIGVNDLGKLSREAPVTVENRQFVLDALLGGYAQIARRARERGIRVLGVTLPPFEGNRRYRSDADAEADRQVVNRWIRARGNLDGHIDFDAVLRDPERPIRMLPAYDSGDHLHPSAAGQDAMGAAVPLDILAGRSR